MAQQKVRSMSEWNTEIREWMERQGWQEIYSVNHPTEAENEVHFIKNKIRCVCIKSYHDEFAYITSDTIFGLPKDLTIRSKSFLIGDSGELNANALWILVNVDFLKNHWKKG